MSEKKFEVTSLNVVFLMLSMTYEIKKNNALQRFVSFRLKQLYEKFDDVVANGRMLAKANEPSDDSMHI